MTANASDDIAEMGFDQVLDRLRKAVHRLETGNSSLEESLRLYEHGVLLARRGHVLLDHAEKRVELLVREGRNGPVTEPLDPFEIEKG